MNIHNREEKTAVYLAASKEFRDRGYTVVSGARVKDVRLNGEPMQGEEIVDLLVCDGDRVLLGIACRREMRGLPYVWLPDDEDEWLPLSVDDEGWLVRPSEACLESLLKSVMASIFCVLRRQRGSLASYREGARKKPEKIYTLPALPPEEIIFGEPGLLQKLAAKHLLRDDFVPTPYGNTHGLFLRYQADPFGDVRPELLTVPSAVAEIRAVLSWKPERADKMKRVSLAERLSRGIAGGEEQTLSDVKTLLNAPVDAFFQDRPEQLQKLQTTLEHGRWLLGSAGSGTDAMPDFRQVLQTIQALRQGFCEDPLMDDDESRRMRRTCESLLRLLSGVFLNFTGAADPAPRGEGFVRNQSLKVRLAHARAGSVARLFSTSLAGYYQTVSRLAECEYPNWVYRSRILPIFQDNGKPESSFNLRFLAAYCDVCLEDNGDHDWNEAFPLLFDLITIPLCIGQR